MVDDKWPFKTDAEAEACAELRSSGYALLREANELWQAAIKERK